MLVGGWKAKKAEHDSWEWLLAEYATLRQESADARTSQQSTITWSLAIFGAVLAAGLIFVSTELKHSTWPSPLTFWFYVALFGVAMPGLAFASCLSYAGELKRMERVGSYLRGLEQHLGLMDLSPRRPLRWETFLRYGVGGNGPKKLYESYLGAAGLYAIAELSSLAIFFIGMISMNPDSTRVLWSSIWTGAVAVAFLGMIVWVLFQLKAASKVVVDYDQIVPILKQGKS
ncbi:MAG: hypothetical protein EPN48_05250 [Microbacteriaceae bacterium]|nr:MAG: hypothetical protein EPN48_05250 [Microbacteriaceae bacterium]